MQQRTFSAGGLDALLAGAAGDARTIVVLMHGYAMRPEDLEPFAHSMRSPALFCFPRGPQTVPGGGYAWWPIDSERRARELQDGPRDLMRESPPERSVRRTQLREFLAALREQHPSLPLVLGGFSQGGMMACDATLAGEPVDALVLLSSSRIAMPEWTARSAVLRDLPVLVSHGRSDADLAFSAGEALRDFHVASGAHVTWQPFDGGHEIPLVVWRALRTFLAGLGLRQRPCPGEL